MAPRARPAPARAEETGSLLDALVLQHRPFPDDRHAVHQRSLNDVERATVLLPGFFGVFVDVVGNVVPNDGVHLWTVDPGTMLLNRLLTTSELNPENRRIWSQDRLGYRTYTVYDKVGRQRFTIYPDANDGIELSYGLGWGLLKTPYGWGAFKEGHGDGFEHYTILFRERGLGVMIMTNSANGESIYKYLLEASIADTYTPWQWQSYIPYDQEPDAVSGNP